MVRDELWKVIPRCDEAYEVSSFGRVRSWRKKGSEDERATSPHLMTGFVAPNGYHRVLLRMDLGYVKRSIHRLVLESFVGEAPEGCEAAHLDGNKDNNRLENLKWVTRRENHRHKVGHGTSLRGERGSKAKLTRDQAMELKRQFALGVSSTQLASTYGINKATVWKIVTGRTWRNLPKVDSMAETLVKLIAAARRVVSRRNPRGGRLILEVDVEALEQHLDEAAKLGLESLGSGR